MITMLLRSAALNLNSSCRSRCTFTLLESASSIAPVAVSQKKSPTLKSSKFFHTNQTRQTSSKMDKFQLAKKYEGCEKNVWVEFNALAAEVKPLNLGQGFPDDLIPEYVLKTLNEVISDPSVLMHQYTRSFGHPRLINALSKLYTKLLARPADLNANTEILVTDGAYEALFCAIMGLVNPGDEVIIIEPYFDCYEPMVRLAGGVPKFISLKPTKTSGTVSSADWKLDPAELAGLFNSKTKGIVFNNPNNPLGKVYTLEEITMVADLCKKHNVVAICDDVYEHMVYPGSEMIRMATLPDMWERTLTIGSAGKTFSVTGWKLGWSVGPKHLMSSCQIVHQNCVYACPTPIQEAVARSFEFELSRFDSPECYFKTIAIDLMKKRDFMVKILQDAGITPVIPEGGYFIMADWSQLAEHVDLNSETDEQRDYRFVK